MNISNELICVSCEGIPNKPYNKLSLIPELPVLVYTVTS